MQLRRFQREFVAKATAPGVDVAALSMPRGNGKSTLAAHIGARLMTPGDALFRAGTESVIVASTLEQGRIVFRFVRAMLDGDSDYRFSDSLTRVQIIHKPTRTVLQVRGANARAMMGLVDTPWVIADEPGAWKVTDGEIMHTALSTAQGKPGSPLKALYIGTLAPAHSGWWPELIERGTKRSTYVKVLQGDRETWDQWQTIRKANPLTAISPEFRAKLLEERDAARKDTRLKARFLSYRLNLPSADESEMLLTVDDYRMATDRPVGIPSGRPIVGIDLGQGRSWSAAVAIWQSGRVDALAVAPGLPDLATQERRDNVPSGTYGKLFDRGVLSVADGLHVQPPGQLWETICDRWGVPVSVVCDRFRLGELQDAVQGSTRLEPRVTQWSTASADIRALRRIARDGPLSIVETARPLLATSLMAALVKNDDAGNSRLVKRSRDNKARDDVAAALTLAAGAYDRASGQPVKAAAYAVA